MNRLSSGAAAVSLMCLASAASGQFIPPPCSPPGPFEDVPDTHDFCPWIQQLANDQITLGCGGGNYCPDSPVTRAQMAFFLERATRGTAAWNPDQARKFYVTQTADAQNGADADTVCAEGYHFASLSEIFDTTQLEYDTTLGYTNPDSGQGPPSAVSGWVRTGYLSYTFANPGQANCANWTSDSASDYGTFVQFSVNWMNAATVISPWAAQTHTCDGLDRSWCVQD